MYNENVGFITGASGTVLRTNDGGATWIPLQAYCQNDLYDIEFLDEQTGIMVGGRGSILRTANAALSVAQRSSLAPQAFLLEQNYPNPFNPSTTIQYQLPTASDVRLEVYDLLGRKVMTLVNAKQMAGTYSVQFNAAALASGVYFYRLQAGATNSASAPFVQTKKMILVK